MKRIQRSPRATWRTCWHFLVLTLTVLLLASSVVLGIVAIWTESGKLGGTAAVLAPSGAVCGLVGWVPTNHRCDYLSVPLPWRRRADDIARGRG